MAGEARARPYAVMVPKTNAVDLGGRRKRIERLVERLPQGSWSKVHTEEEAGGRRLWEWACVELLADPAKGMRRWLLVRRDPEEPEDLAHWLAYGPEGTTVGELLRACDTRWAIEECFAQTKGEVGLDQYEVRRWEAWHRYVTLCLLAHAFLVVTTRLTAREEEVSGKRGGGPEPVLIPLTVPEVRRLVLAMAEPEGRRRFRLGWSAWRRAHQAVAARCRVASRRRRATIPPVGGPYSDRAGPDPVAPVLEKTGLTEAEWERVTPLLPPQKPAIGRTRNEHRAVLGGILWVARTASSWREMPEEYGKWETANRRYQLWLGQGLWRLILEALGEEDLPGPETKRP